jgi:16S rRNA (guanine527-N7)-methyltransferase
VEDYHAARFDVIVSRAFAALAEMVRLTAHLLAPGGCWAAMKGIYPAEEIGALPSTVELVGAVKLRVPLLGAERHLVVLRPR